MVREPMVMCFEMKVSAKPDEMDLTIYDRIGGDWEGKGTTAENVQKALAENADAKVINISINSGGGDVFQGNAIFNLLDRHSARKVISIDGLAASMASLIAMVGDEIRMPQNAMMMVHNPSGMAFGKAVDLRKTADFLDKLRDTAASCYASRTKQTPEKICKMMDDETWMTAKEALNLGFADIITPVRRVAAQADLSRFENLPSGLADLWKSGPEKTEMTEQEATVLIERAKAAESARVQMFTLLGLDEKATAEQMQAKIVSMQRPADMVSAADYQAAIGRLASLEKADGDRKIEDLVLQAVKDGKAPDQDRQDVIRTIAKLDMATAQKHVASMAVAAAPGKVPVDKMPIDGRQAIMDRAAKEWDATPILQNMSGKASHVRVALTEAGMVVPTKSELEKIGA